MRVTTSYSTATPLVQQSEDGGWIRPLLPGAPLDIIYADGLAGCLPFNIEPEVSQACCSEASGTLVSKELNNMRLIDQADLDAMFGAGTAKEESSKASGGYWTGDLVDTSSATEGDDYNWCKLSDPPVLARPPTVVNSPQAGQGNFSGIDTWKRCADYKLSRNAPNPASYVCVSIIDQLGETGFDRVLNFSTGRGGIVSYKGAGGGGGKGGGSGDRKGGSKKGAGQSGCAGGIGYGGGIGGSGRTGQSSASARYVARIGYMFVYLLISMWAISAGGTW